MSRDERAPREFAGSGNRHTSGLSGAADLYANGTTNTVAFSKSSSRPDFRDLPVPVTRKADIKAVTFANSTR
ncbi:hypothetical protein PYK79_16770 [Streptomyces sp. ID05-04B]|nr:hypothetical protein [Streptomyces sp. ID05-04B]